MLLWSTIKLNNYVTNNDSRSIRLHSFSKEKRKEKKKSKYLKNTPSCNLRQHAHAHTHGNTCAGGAKQVPRAPQCNNPAGQTAIGGYRCWYIGGQCSQSATKLTDDRSLYGDHTPRHGSRLKSNRTCVTRNLRSCSRRRGMGEKARPCSILITWDWKSFSGKSV